MRHFPIYLDTRGQRVCVSGGDACALAKLRLILKTEAEIHVFADPAAPEILSWAAEGRLVHHPRALRAEDLAGALLLYAANDAPDLDAAVARLGRDAGVKTLIVDNLNDSDFITPAIVDRSPVTVAIGTEGAAPVLARKIKADIEEMLPATLGPLARIGQAFRPIVARLPLGWARREFWTRYYFDQGPKALAEGEWAAEYTLRALLDQIEREAPPAGQVAFIGAGPGDPELLTLRARKLLHEAEVVIHDRLVSPQVLELARREATLIEVGKTAFGPSWDQADINALLVEHGATARVVRLKSGDCGMFGRLDEETAALRAASVPYSVTPGITAAAAAAATLGQSLTRRGRNSALRMITAHEAEGFAEHDWRALARPGTVTAIYMGKALAGLLRGRLLMHGAAPDMPVAVVENVSRPDQTIVPTTLLSLADAVAGLRGPAVLLLGLDARKVALETAKEAL